MAVIRICERFIEARSFAATVSIDDGRTNPIRICDPFSEAENQLLEWYFEEYPRFPFVQQIEAQRAAASITNYGEALFIQVFADPEVRLAYKECIQTGLDTLQFEIIGSPQFHKLHWEALMNFKKLIG